MDEKLVKCSKISINCVKNDPIDIKYGGPQYLGFDFYVREEQQDKMKQIICKTINEAHIPIESITITNDFYKDIDCIWSKEIEIRKQINKNSTYLYKNAVNICRKRETN